jgi:hypothetical protein
MKDRDGGALVWGLNPTDSAREFETRNVPYKHTAL